MRSNFKNLLKVDQVAKRLGIRLSLVYRLIRTGELPNLAFGSHIRVRERGLDDFTALDFDEENVHGSQPKHQ